MHVPNPHGHKSPLFPLVDEFTKEFEGLSDKLVPLIEKNLDKGYAPRVAVDRAFALLGVSELIKNSILDKVVLASALGYGVKVVASPEAIKTAYLNTTWPGRKFSLAETIAKGEFKEIVKDTVHSELSKQTTYNKIARSLTDKGLIKGDLPKHLKMLVKKSHTYLSGSPELKRQIRVSAKKIERLSLNGSPNQRLKIQYQNLVNAIEKGTQKQFSRALKYAVREKARYNAERIARTEIANAYGVANDIRNLEDEDVIGVRFSLSSRHPIRDICDHRANANLYGMGPGVYPKNKRPRYPFHPHCMCVRSQVFVGETTVGKFNKGSGEEYLNSLSTTDQKSMLGVQGRKDWKGGKGWDKVLRGYTGEESISVGGLRKEMFR